MPKILAAGLFVASLIIPSASVPGVPSGGTTAVPPKIPVTVTMVTANGTGCPGGTTAVVPYPDGTGLHVIYNDYGVRDGAGVPLTEARKNCQVSLQVRAPSGFTYAVSRASYRGHADLVPGTPSRNRSKVLGASSRFPRRTRCNSPRAGRTASSTSTRSYGSATALPRADRSVSW
jgi:hypothetical protein